MFVRIKWVGDGDKAPYHTMDELIESNHIKISQPINDENTVFIEALVDGKLRHFHLKKNGAEIYFMNNQGKTIDSYQWEFKSKSQVSS